VHTWLGHQFTVRAVVERRVRLFVRVTESQLVQRYQNHQRLKRLIGAPLDNALREHIRRLFTERQVDVRLTE
jgi:hypothetical protein